MLLQGHFFFSSSPLLSLYSTPTPPPHLTLSSISLSLSRIELSCSSNRQHRESLVHLGSLTDGYFTPIIWVLCVCLRRCVCERRKSTHTHTHFLLPSPHPPQHCAPAAIDGVSEPKGDVLINLDTLGIDLTSCCNDLLVFVKDHCLSGPQLIRWACLIVMETIITAELGRGFFQMFFFCVSHKQTQIHFLYTCWYWQVLQ